TQHTEGPMLKSVVGRATEWLVTLTWRIEGGLLCKLFDSLTTKCQRLPCSFNGLPPSRQYFGVTSVGHTVASATQNSAQQIRVLRFFRRDFRYWRCYQRV
ncbi:unnamed protein product, partial [Closterium sp. NIES-53]